MRINKSYEPEIDLKDLLFHILYRWRSILLFILAGALLLGGQQTLSARGFDREKHAADVRAYWESVKGAQDTVAAYESRIAELDGSVKEAGGAGIGDPERLEREKELSSLNEQYNTLLKAAKERLSEIRSRGEPADPGKSVAKRAVIGGIAGLLLAVILYAALYVLRGRLTDSGLITERYGLPILGERRRSGSLHGERGLDRLLARWELGKNREDAEAFFDRTGALIAGSTEAKTLLLVSTLPGEKVNPVREALAERLKETGIEARGALLQDPQTVSAAAEAEAVILVEEKGVSRCREIERAAETLAISGAKAAGAILL